MRQAAGWRVWGMASVLRCCAAVARPQQSAPRPGASRDGAAAATLPAARALLDANDFEHARATLSAVLAREPESAPAHDLLGQMLERAGDLPAAEAAYAAAIRYAPGMATAHDHRGFVLGRLGRTAAALDEFATATTLDPALFDGAIAQFREAIRLSADNPQAHYQLALALQRRGATAEARAHFAEARRLSAPTPQGAR